VGPSHEGRAHQMLMRVNVRCHICLSFFSICTCVLLTMRHSKHVQCHRRHSLKFCCVSLHVYKSVTETNTRFDRIQPFLSTVRPTVPVRFSNLEVQEGYLPIIRNAGTLCRCVPSHFNHCSTASFISPPLPSPHFALFVPFMRWGECGMLAVSWRLGVA